MAQPNPMPYSTPRTAGRLKSALARSAFSLSKTGSPRPAGTPVATTSATPPTEFRSARIRSMSATIRAARAGSGQRTTFGSPEGSVSTCCGGDRGRIVDGGHDVADLAHVADHPAPERGWRSSFFAMAPAATRTVVSRALERPPPR